MTGPAAGPGPPARQHVAGWALVAAQGVLLAMLIWPIAPRWSPAAWVSTLGSVARVVGLAVAAVGVIGLGGSLTPSPVPKASAALVTRGLYRWVRHPIYAGLLAFACGSALSTPHPIRVVAAVGLWALLDGKSRWEERLLRERLPGYAAYAATVGRFLPLLRRRGAGGDGR